MALKMAWSKSTRIKVMIAIDTTFFLLELICGFVANSLALTADAFHMLNDIISLVIGLWAVNVSQKEKTDEFTFGLLRAEILGAFFNAVFLIALCVSIILEALTRFIEPPEIKQPQLIFIVGCTGLASNLLGFVILGGHGHSHGDEEDGHGHHHDHHDDHDEHDHVHEHAIEGGQGSGDSHSKNVAVANGDTDKNTEIARRIKFAHDAPIPDESSSRSRNDGQSRGRAQRQSSKSGHARFHSIEDFPIYPPSLRQDIIDGRLAASSGAGRRAESDTSEDGPTGDSDTEINEESPLLRHGGSQANNGALDHHSHPRGSHRRSRRDSSIHDGHHHTLPRKAGLAASGHNHADMGMNAMILHVIGDALGNVGVIITALVIWLTDWPLKHYYDPLVSLFITVIILKTSIPLTRATARVLLQATPENISIQEIREDIKDIPGVDTCHDIHIWQLSDTRVVASMHLRLKFAITEDSGEKYMQLAKRVKKCLHGYGIHRATIQPEFHLNQDQRHAGDAEALCVDGSPDGTGEADCLLECVDDCQGQGCCPAADIPSKASSTRRGSISTQGEVTDHRH